VFGFEIADSAEIAIAEGQQLFTSMSHYGSDAQLFEAFVRPMLERGLSVRFEARGCSMSPAIRDGEIVEVSPAELVGLRKDDIVLAKSECGFRLHRIVMLDLERDVFVGERSPD
jgi:hypothetical protein